MTEFNLDADICTPFQCLIVFITTLLINVISLRTSENLVSWYDISNIEGFKVGQEIEADGGETVNCPNAGCSCTQAYGQGST